MLRDLKDAIIQFISHRLFALTVIFIGLMIILVYRLFQLQIVNGEDYLDNFNLMSEKTITTAGQRGNIYDADGNLLAYNRLTYSLTFGNDSEISNIALKKKTTENNVKNDIIYQLLQILEENGDHIVNSFEIKLNKNDQFVFSTNDKNTILAFKKEVYGRSSTNALTKKEKNASAKDVFEYLKNGNEDIKKDKMFGVSDTYDNKTALNIVAIRYMVYLNRYNQYVPVTIARDISEKSVAALKENSNSLPGVEVETDSVREYNYCPYFSQILGYTGIISEEEKDNYNKNLKEKDQYIGTELVGKTGLEQKYEKVLRGKNGAKTVLVDNVGQILETKDDEVKSTTGNDLYLTIDAELQKKCYTTIEKYLAGILLTYMQNTNVKSKSGKVNIPITEVYFALFDNNVINVEHLTKPGASATEKKIASSVKSARSLKMNSIKKELLQKKTAFKDLSDDNREYLAYVYNMLKKKEILKTSEIDTNNETYINWKSEKISLGEFLEYSIHQNWMDLSKFNLSDSYYDTDEVLNALCDYITEQLKDDAEFSKLVLKNLITNHTISEYDCCMILYDQGILDKKKDEDYSKLKNGTLSPFHFMYNKIKKLEIKPSQLALDPCSGSIVVTDVKTGKVKALASYPGYDNNRLANSLDNDYYASLLVDKTSPFLNRATQSSTAPGSTFKMISSIAGLSEGVISTSSGITCTGIYKNTFPPAKCVVYPSSHGRINVKKAIEVSCNVFFFEVGHRLANRSNGTYDEEYGLSRLHKYASMFCLDKTSGIELPENEPKVSDNDPIRSAIGQATNSYTPVQLSRYVTALANSGTCYQLSLLDKQTDSDGKVVKKYKSKVTNQIDLDSSIWDVIHEGMFNVVHGREHGSIFKSLHTDVAGKTGTAEQEETRPAHGLFVSYGPYKNPEISVTVVLPYGYSSANAMEVAKDIYQYYFSDKEKAAEKKKGKPSSTKKTTEDDDAVLPTNRFNTAD